MGRGLFQLVARAVLEDQRRDRVLEGRARDLGGGAARGSRVPLEPQGCVHRDEHLPDPLLSRRDDDCAHMRPTADHPLPDSR
jgi:hypothetical protein